MRREVREVRMQLAPEVLNELSCGTRDIRHQRIAELLHTRIEIIQPGRRETPQRRAAAAFLQSSVGTGPSGSIAGISFAGLFERSRRNRFRGSE